MNEELEKRIYQELIKMTKKQIRVDLVKYCLEMEISTETLTENDWSYIIGKSKGSFNTAVDIIKEELELVN
jgi:hypothetical protein